MGDKSYFSFLENETKIVKAKFIVENVRFYNLEFDQNIQMKAVKSMIRVAAHLKKNNFRLFVEGQEYTQYHEETFDSIFPEENYVVFTVKKGEGEVFDEAELLLQINSPCQNHPEKFLMFYCFDCSCSICCDCFIYGIHKGHHIQDKCFYLLPSKFLVERMLHSWSKNPFVDYKITCDLSSLKNKVNNVLFAQLYQILKDVQSKCNELIDNYNNVNLNCEGNIRDSVRDIRVACIKALDDLKEKINVKDIVNNPKIFKEFDIAYKKLGNMLNEKFKQNLESFKQLNQVVSVLVNSFIEKIYNMLLDSLKDALNQQQYNNIKIQINQKLIVPTDINSIINQFRAEFINKNN